ncbi:MAG: N-acetyltransferase [Phormidesmis sp.]
MTENAVRNITIRPTTLSDLAFVLAAEQDAENAPYVGQWTTEQHKVAIASPDEAHFIAQQRHTAVGYFILQGLTNPHQTLHLRRIVVTQKRQGYGRQILQWAKAHTFDTLGFHRLWLDVIETNHRAKALYESEGFVREGIFRESWKTATGYRSLIIMSVLAQEYSSL